jgi:hypothetical protein
MEHRKYANYRGADITMALESFEKSFSASTFSGLVVAK